MQYSYPKLAEGVLLIELRGFSLLFQNNETTNYVKRNQKKKIQQK